MPHKWHVKVPRRTSELGEFGGGFRTGGLCPQTRAVRRKSNKYKDTKNYVRLIRNFNKKCFTMFQQSRSTKMVHCHANLNLGNGTRSQENILAASFQSAVDGMSNEMHAFLWDKPCHTSHLKEKIVRLRFFICNLLVRTLVHHNDELKAA